MKMLAVDPGGRTGYVIYKDGSPDLVGEVEYERVFKWLNEVKTEIGLELIVYEDYIIRAGSAGKNFNHQWNKGEALKVIGGLLTIATELNIPAIAQQPSIKPIAAKQCNLPYDPKKKGRGTHMQDAMLHGHWWLKKNAS